MGFLDLLFLGAVAGFTIYFGLPIALAKGVSSRTKGLLNAAAAGILLFLLVDIMHDAIALVQGKLLGALTGNAAAFQAGLYSLALAGGFSLGLLGLVWFEGRFIRQSQAAESSEQRARRLAFMIAAGIGLHNFSEGLAIGQSYASGAISLALLLVIGFGLHNATEGFGIAAPLAGFKPDKRFLALLGLVGGGPTFLGAVIGGVWASNLLSLLFLSLAGGAVVYVVKEMLYHGKTQGEGVASMAALVVGFLAGFATQVLVSYAVA